MKRLALATACILTFAASIHAQAPNAAAAAAAAAQDQQIAAIARELQAQQAVIAENQAKIEAKLAALGEAVRVARIYSSRGGQSGQ
jgi:hypothetical protein